MLWHKVHFIGIGGVGMSATAKLLKDMGVSITGSDEAVYPPMSTFLESQNLPYRTPYAATNIPDDAGAIVIGKNAKLVPETNEEVAAAFASGKPILSFPEVLAQLSENKETVVIAGSYGKSSSTALFAHILESAGLDPSFFIGALPITPATSARMGEDDLFLLEGDEYPSSNTDPRSKFLHYHPAHLLITPLAHDHFNVFPTEEEYLAPFFKLAALVPQSGNVVVCTGGSLSGEFLARVGRPVITYGLADGDYRAADIAWGERTSFTIERNGAPIVRVETSQLGKHNIQNIVGVAAFLFSRNIVSPQQFAAGVASFRGLVRRLDRKSERTSLPMFEGFGSSYEKAKSAIAAMKQHFPDKRLVIVFEPHTFSWRNRDALPWYDDVFAGTEKVFIYEPAAQGAATHKQLAHEEIVGRVRASGIAAEAITNPTQALDAIEKELQPNDAVLLLSSGPLGGIIEPLIAFAEQKFPKHD